uniref:Fibronectin type-III domain-containing protein n=1 Tax=Kryptolebias marmoratus TaxID=37003 RepID=A0A3Q3EY83_KRYMA
WYHNVCKINSTLKSTQTLYFERSNNGPWLNPPECQQIPHTHCDLTFDLASNSDYIIQVRAQCRSQLSAWTGLQFNRKDTTLEQTHVVGDKLKTQTCEKKGNFSAAASLNAEGLQQQRFPRPFPENHSLFLCSWPAEPYSSSCTSCMVCSHQQQPMPVAALAAALPAASAAVGVVTRN